MALDFVPDLGISEADDEPFPLPNVNAGILRKVITWAQHHKDDPPPPEDEEDKEKRTDDIDPWDQEFLKVDQGTLFELILAAGCLDIKGLMHVTCKTVANMIKGKKPTFTSPLRCYFINRQTVEITDDICMQLQMKTEIAYNTSWLNHSMPII